MYFRDYNPQSANLVTKNDHDICLMMVSDPFVYTEYVRPACLPAEKTFEIRRVGSDMLKSKIIFIIMSIFFLFLRRLPNIHIFFNFRLSLHKSIQGERKPRCIISGWGTTEKGGTSSKLLHRDIPMHSFRECRRQVYGRITKNGICGGGNGPDSCQGMLQII